MPLTFSTYLLQENGDRLILEDGSGFILLDTGNEINTAESYVQGVKII